MSWNCSLFLLIQGNKNGCKVDINELFINCIIIFKYSREHDSFAAAFYFFISLCPIKFTKMQQEVVRQFESRAETTPSSSQSDQRAEIHSNQPGCHQSLTYTVPPKYEFQYVYYYYAQNFEIPIFQRNPINMRFKLRVIPPVHMKGQLLAYFSCLQ